MTPGLKETIKSEKNKFFFGDPCYALKDIYYKHWIDWGMDREAKDGTYCNDGTLVVDGKNIMSVCATKYGDGLYDGIAVDSGSIALIPWEYVDPKKVKDNGDELGKVFTVRKGTEAKFITFIGGKIRCIYTGTKGGQETIDIETGRGYTPEEPEEDEWETVDDLDSWDMDS